MGVWPKKITALKSSATAMAATFDVKRLIDVMLFSLKGSHYPVFRRPAEIPLIVAASASFSSGVSWPARFRRSSSI